MASVGQTCIQKPQYIQRRYVKSNIVAKRQPWAIHTNKRHSMAKLGHNKSHKRQAIQRSKPTTKQRQTCIMRKYKQTNKQSMGLKHVTQPTNIKKNNNKNNKQSKKNIKNTLL